LEKGGLLREIRPIFPPGKGEGRAIVELNQQKNLVATAKASMWIKSEFPQANVLILVLD